MCPLNLEPSEWIHNNQVDGPWQPLCASFAGDEEANVYGVCVTRREIELLTATRVPKHWNGWQRLQLRTGLDQNRKNILVYDNTANRPNGISHCILPEVEFLEDPTAQRTLRPFTIAICFYPFMILQEEDAVDYVHRVQRRIVEFVKSLLGRPQLVDRARALLECMKDCEEIIKTYTQKPVLLSQDLLRAFPSCADIDESALQEWKGWNSNAELDLTADGRQAYLETERAPLAFQWAEWGLSPGAV